MALVGLACGGAATAMPSAKSTPVPIAAPAPTATPKPTAAPTAASKREEVTLRVGIPLLLQPPDPVKGGGFNAVSTGLAETLFKLGRDLRPEPWLATGARQLDDKTWEITVRQGVKFHNGAPMDATAVKASLERAVAKSPTAKALLDISQIEVKGPSTLVVATSKPNLILPAMLADPSSTIVDAAAAEAMGDAFTEMAVLTGPFKIERFQQDKEWVVVRHKEYWGPPPLVDRVIFSVLPDGNSRVLALQSGDIDIAINIAPESVATVRSASNLTVKSAAPLLLNFMYLNHRREAWKDVRVRQAIALAINREALVNAVMLGQATAATGAFPPAVLKCNEVKGYPFDPAKARQLLTQAGYQDKDGDGFVEKDGQSLAMTLLNYRQQPHFPPMAEAIQAMLKTVGIKVTVRLVENINTALGQADWDGGMYSNNMASTGDPYWALSQFFLTGGSANRGGYSNPRIDDLTNQVAISAERQARVQFACAGSQAIVDELPVVPLLYPSFNYGVSTKVVGFDEPHPFFLYFMDSKIGKQ
jgi:peptide/nickel transport system substrate-binding protein